jgi:hypothetical protein
MNRHYLLQLVTMHFGLLLEAIFAPISVVLFVCFHPKLVMWTVVDIRTRIQFSLHRTLVEVRAS